MNRQVLITALVLTLFAAIGGGLVSYTEQSTASQIRVNDKMMLLHSLKSLLPAQRYDNDLASSAISIAPHQLLGTTKTSRAYSATKNTDTVAFIFNVIANNGYNGKIYLLIGVYTDGSIAGVRVVRHKETPGLGDAIDENRSSWILNFNQHSLSSLTEKQWKVKRDGGYFDQFTGATITPRAVVNAVHNTLLYYQQHKAVLLQATTKPVSPKE
ncbi:MAG: electron transport complex subunit RsxG [Gammaproteobacteria bacterium]|nr:electron transport complex subunit RsxG [Gammaproteobacteria bacterium]